VSDRYVLVKRLVWIVEGTPKDRYYLYGKIILRLDKENFGGSAPTPRSTIGRQPAQLYLPGERGALNERARLPHHSTSVFTMAQNWKLNRATVSEPLKGGRSDTLIQFKDQQFETDMLARGK
jgi:hypothetical protein